MVHLACVLCPLSKYFVKLELSVKMHMLTRFCVRAAVRRVSVIPKVTPTTVLTTRKFHNDRLVRQEEAVAEEQQPQQTTERQKVFSRVPSSRLPFHTPKEIESYPRATFTLRNIRQSDCKVNDVCRLIRKLNTREAIAQLELDHSKGSRILAKWLQSVVKQAENSHGMNVERLLVNKAFVGRGTVTKRVRYHAKGRHGIMTHKRTHVTVELVEVPMKENERRLGVRGWKNETWQRHDEVINRMREIVEELHRELGRKVTAREIYDRYKAENLHRKKPKQTMEE